jgi:hypothetical protein
MLPCFSAVISFKADVHVDVRDRLDPIARLMCAPGVRRGTWVKIEAPENWVSVEGAIFKASGLLNERELREARRQ